VWSKSYRFAECISTPELRGAKRRSFRANTRDTPLEALAECIRAILDTLLGGCGRTCSDLGRVSIPLIGGERDHLAQKCYLVGDVIEDAHGNADIEGILEVELEEVGVDEPVLVGKLVLLCLPGTKPEYRFAGKVLKPDEGALPICLESGGCMQKTSSWLIPTTPYLVTSLRDFPHELRIRIGNIANHEKSRLNPRFVQHIE
jgi:hypothetical protein